MDNLDYNYVYFDNSSDPFYLSCLRDLENQEGIIVENPLMSKENKLVKLLYKIHNSGRINRIVPLPFKRIWNKKLFRNKFSNNKPICFVFASPLYRLRWVGYFEFLKKRYPDCKLVYCCRDLYSNYFDWYKGFDDKYVKETFDLILDYDVNEIKKYNLTFYTDFESNLACRKEHSILYDVVFIGAAKDRINLILNAYDYFISNGLSCFFYITGADISLQEKYKNIIFGEKWMPYDQVIEKTLQSKCILEIVQGESSGWTARAMKAFAYNKKLITNSKAVTYTRFFDNKNVQFFERPTDIVIDYIKSESMPDFKYNNEFSPLSVLEYIDGLLTEKWDSVSFFKKWFDLEGYMKDGSSNN